MKTVKRLICLVLALVIPFVCVLAEGASSVDAARRKVKTPKVVPVMTSRDFFCSWLKENWLK